MELWLENRFLVEIVTEPEVSRYRAFTTSQNWRAVIEHEPMPLAQFGYAEAWLKAPP